MASIFTYQEEPHRVHSPWSTPGSATPQKQGYVGNFQPHATIQDLGIKKLEPERHDGPTEYKLHLLLRPRRTFTRISTHSAKSGPQYARSPPGIDSSRGFLDSMVNHGGMSQPSSQTRQARLQQLTTQLLWRLQQSSPFHSSSNAELVLPVLPEATPKLGMSDRPSKLLPGLEESQGALYEIGVADDGTLLGLLEEELEESLGNLRAMASSLGCVVDVLRRVVVGNGQWNEMNAQTNALTSRDESLWVAEVLVRPDNKSVEVIPAIPTQDLGESVKDHEDFVPTTVQEDFENEQLRVAIVGSSTSGKSSLIGTLTSSTPDNGRGKSRLSLLKHRHEIASGITSSVAQELVGYRTDERQDSFVVNYATGNVSSWSDIHNLANRLVFLSDSPGLSRYAKSTFRSLVSWDPAWVVLCIASDDGELKAIRPGSPLLTAESLGVEPRPSSDTADLSMAHLNICLKLGLPLIIAVTKMDIATKNGLRGVLSKLLSAIKTAGRTPVLLSTQSSPGAGLDDSTTSANLERVSLAEQQEIDRLLDRLRTSAQSSIVPIVMTSAVSGVGVGKVHAVLRDLPLPDRNLTPNPDLRPDEISPFFDVDEVFAIPPSKVYTANKEDITADHGLVLCGHMRSGTLSVGDELRLGPFIADPETEADSQPMGRSLSHSVRSNHQSQLPRSLSENFSKSLQLDGRRFSGVPQDAAVVFIPVRIVSLRNLRLPVRSMRIGETGTVGVQPTICTAMTHSAPLSRARKGMVLACPKAELSGCRSFRASFSPSEFGSMASPPLILGGHAIVYINSVRAAVRVVSLSLGDEDGDGGGKAERAQTPSTSNHEMFSLDDVDDIDEDGDGCSEVHVGMRDISIHFEFVSSVEHITSGGKLLVVPTMTSAGPVTGPGLATFSGAAAAGPSNHAGSTTGITSTSSSTAPAVTGLSGFVGRVGEVYT